MTLPPGISIGRLDDVKAITNISNKAYKGNGQGWTDWAHLQNILQDVTRTNENDVQALMERYPSVFVIYTGEDGTLQGSLYLEDIGEKKYHLWLMAVDPSRQNQGIGRKLLNGACEYSKQNGYELIELLTSTSRVEVVAWYERCGFTKTGKVVQFDLSTVIPVPIGSLSEEVEMVKYLR